MTQQSKEEQARALTEQAEQAANASDKGREAAEVEVTDEEAAGPINAKERFYERLIKRFHITKKGMDVVLIVLIALFVLFFALGALKGNNIL